MTRRERFWRWLSAVAVEKARSAYMDRCHHDRRCPNCKRWISETDGAQAARQIDIMTDGMTCKACGYESRWEMHAMLPLLSPQQPSHIPYAEPAHDAP